MGAAQTRRMDMPAQMREATLLPSTYSKDDASIDLAWTTGVMRRTYDWMTDVIYDEELVVDESSVNMTRFNAGTLQVIDGHKARDGVRAILGIARNAWLKDGTGYARIQFRTSTPELAAIASDAGEGLLRAISFGYSVEEYQIIPAAMRTDGAKVPLYRATRWTPQEISFVAVPADPHAGTRSQTPAQGHSTTATPCEFVRAANAQPQEPSQMPATINTTVVSQNDDQTRAAADAAGAQAAAAQAAAQTAAAEAATRSADITDLCTRHGVPALASGLIRGNSTLDQARAAVLEEIARTDSARGGHVNVGAGSVRTVQDEVQTRMQGMEEAILSRMDSSVKLTDNGRRFRSLGLLEMGRDYLHARGVSTVGMDKMRVASEMLNFRSGAGMHTTSDFASIMANVANKRLRNAYDENPGTYAMWARRAPNAPDFKNISVAQLSGAPELLRTNEHAEFTYGTMRDGAETYAVLTHGRIVSLTRQAIINDDLRAFDRMVGAFGNSARRLENRLVYAQLTANANLSDGVALFSTATGARAQANVQTGAGSALQLSSLSAGRAQMRLMRGLNDEELNIAPAYLIVPAALEQTAYQLTSANYVPATTSAINEFRAGGRTAVMPVVEPLLDAASATQWYLAASSSQVDTVEYCYLDGAEGPVIEQEVGFEVDGVSYKCRLDFGAKAVDFRGLHRAAGA
jgi:hypothetical protein